MPHQHHTRNAASAAEVSRCSTCERRSLRTRAACDRGIPPFAKSAKDGAPGTRSSVTRSGSFGPGRINIHLCDALHQTKRLGTEGSSRALKGRLLFGNPASMRQTHPHAPRPSEVDQPVLTKIEMQSIESHSLVLLLNLAGPRKDLSGTSTIC